MSIRHFRFRLWPLLAVLGLSACSHVTSHLPWQHDRAAAPVVQQSLMKSLSGIVSYDVPQPLPAGSYLLVTLDDVSKQDVAPHRIAEERIEPVEASPVEFHLSYEPGDLEQGVDFAVSARLQQGDTLLAVSDERVNVLSRSSEQEPVKIALKTVQPTR